MRMSFKVNGSPRIYSPLLQNVTWVLSYIRNVTWLKEVSLQPSAFFGPLLLNGGAAEGDGVSLYFLK